MLWLVLFRWKKVWRGKRTLCPYPPPPRCWPAVGCPLWRTTRGRVYRSPGEAAGGPSKFQRRTCPLRRRRCDSPSRCAAATTSWRKWCRRDTTRTPGPSTPPSTPWRWACTTTTTSSSSPWTWAPSGWDELWLVDHWSDCLIDIFQSGCADMKSHILRKRWSRAATHIQRNLLPTSGWCSPTATNTIRHHMRWSTWQENCRYTPFYNLICVLDLHLKD